jgi:hypothetical protein
MNLAEYYDVEHVLDAEAQALARWCAEHGRNAPAGDQPPVASPSQSGPPEGSGQQPGPSPASGAQ